MWVLDVKENIFFSFLCAKEKVELGLTLASDLRTFMVRLGFVTVTKWVTSSVQSSE